MIPYRLQFSGIRDFLPSSLDLGGDGHVMITGPNGSGKSTLTFCMGAALYSSKVDIEGLKSRNLPPDQVWKAHVSVLFRNEGSMKIDEPAFIQFTIYIVQEPGQPIKREFIVQKGDHADEWESTTKYTSGDRYHNFSAYKKDLQFRYKIHPDLFYLIWYQQEVNQFAVMNSEERFRIFSEMHGIDHMQRNWEESIEKVKEAEETMRQAEQNMLFHKQNLSILKTALDRFIDNQRRLRSGAQQSLEALLSLELHYNNEIKMLKRSLEDLNGELEETKENSGLIFAQKEETIERLKQLEAETNKLNQIIDEVSERLEDKENENTKIVAEKESLEKELEDLMARKKRIERTEEQANLEFTRLTDELTKISEEQSLLEKEIDDKEQNRIVLINEKAKLEAQIVQDDIQEKDHLERLTRFGSSFSVEENISRLNQTIQENKDLLHETKREIDSLKDERMALQEDRNVSDRQKQSLDYFRERGIAAFPLRELIELDESAKVNDENLFNSIKYTVFFNGKTASPPNDLYHVPLMEIIPDRWRDHLPEIHLKVKNNIAENKYNHAVKALFWIGQFFKDNEPRIGNEILIDSRGIRGPQEKQAYILSQKAIQIRLQEISHQIHSLEDKADSLQKVIEEDTEDFQYLNSEIQKVKEAEAFMTNRHEREQWREKFTSYLEKEQTLNWTINELRTKSTGLMQTSAELTEQLKIVQKELDFYKELGASKEKYEKLQYVVKLEKETVQEIKSLNLKLDRLDSDLEKLSKSISRTKRKIDDKQQELEDIGREERDLNNQIQRYSNRLAINENELIQVIQELQDMQNLVPELYKEYTAQFTRDQPTSEEALKNQLQNGKVMFNGARSEDGIDPAAKENYDTAKSEYERLDHEFKQSKVLLEADKERTDKLKFALETTINMRVLEIQKRFTVYMGEFQFEGDIGWDSQEDKQGRTHFHLYIRARKEGHRGPMEDVSVKARGGKVGKGVSGGEESLSSLLFALALLQNIETAPGFIVLDEFDSALDEHRKSKVFDLYVNQLQRKLIILTPKTHEEEYINRFQKAFIVQHDPRVPRSKVTGLKMIVE
ncbi:AAA family ATPase [Oceanobacillus luteolus]|uniref:AAA family ATPase n=1 Tax=Oceanobacillus luteolus TaxID=1274358 RepID=UPI00203DB5C4|nr:AAA family ATPase [Oceanobacillus luteolus]MCM3741507.1 AAA family ATPase [Oceanobacillus luteolus]